MLVIGLGLGAALALAVGYVLQQHVASEAPAGARGPAILLALARRPVWLGGIGAMVVGQLLGAVALGEGSLVVVEPLLAANVLFALVIGATWSRRRLSRGDWLGAVLFLAGLPVLLYGLHPVDAATTAEPGPLTWALTLLAVAVLVAVLAGLGRGRTPRVRAALLATGAGSLYGLQDVLTQRVVLAIGDGGGAVTVVRDVATSWEAYLLLATAVTGLTLSQRAFGLADLSASLPATALAEPVVGIVLSAVVLGSQLPATVTGLATGAAGLALVVLAVVVLTRSPLVTDPHARACEAPGADLPLDAAAGAVDGGPGDGGPGDGGPGDGGPSGRGAGGLRAAPAERRPPRPGARAGGSRARTGPRGPRHPA